MKRLYYLDKLGWPVERIKGRWFLNFLRILIHTRKYTFKKPCHLAIPGEKDKEGRPLDATLEILQDLRDVTAVAMQRSHGIDLAKGVQENIVRYITEGHSIPNALTHETVEKVERGEGIKLCDTVEEMFEDLDN